MFKCANLPVSIFALVALSSISLAERGPRAQERFRLNGSNGQESEKRIEKLGTIDPAKASENRVKEIPQEFKTNATRKSRRNNEEIPRLGESPLKPESISNFHEDHKSMKSVARAKATTPSWRTARPAFETTAAERGEIRKEEERLSKIFKGYEEQLTLENLTRVGHPEETSAQKLAASLGKQFMEEAIRTGLIDSINSPAAERLKRTIELVANEAVLKEEARLLRALERGDTVAPIDLESVRTSLTEFFKDAPAWLKHVKDVPGHEGLKANALSHMLALYHRTPQLLGQKMKDFVAELKSGKNEEAVLALTGLLYSAESFAKPFNKALDAGQNVWQAHHAGRKTMTDFLISKHLTKEEIEFLERECLKGPVHFRAGFLGTR